MLRRTAQDPDPCLSEEIRPHASRAQVTYRRPHSLSLSAFCCSRSPCVPARRRRLAHRMTGTLEAGFVDVDQGRRSARPDHGRTSSNSRSIRPSETTRAGWCCRRTRRVPSSRDERSRRSCRPHGDSRECRSRSGSARVAPTSPMTPRQICLRERSSSAWRRARASGKSGTRLLRRPIRCLASDAACSAVATCRRPSRTQTVRKQRGRERSGSRRSMRRRSASSSSTSRASRVARSTLDDGRVSREPVTVVRFGQLSLLDQLMHTVASPAVAYLLLAIGLALLVFELFTAGVGVAGVVGAGSFVLSCYGLAVLPTNWWGVRADRPVDSWRSPSTCRPACRGSGPASAWCCSSSGRSTLYDGLSPFVDHAQRGDHRHPADVHRRHAVHGAHRVLDADHRARMDDRRDRRGGDRRRPRRASCRCAKRSGGPRPIGRRRSRSCDRVRVVGIEGLVLEVEPEEGGARDYRERRTTAADRFS